MSESKGPENLSDVVGRLFAARGWGRRSERVRLEEAWTAVAGPAAADTRLGGFRRGVLEVEVRTGVLMQELAQFQKRTLLARLRQALPGVTVADLRFRAGAW